MGSIIHQHIYICHKKHLTLVTQFLFIIYIDCLLLPSPAYISRTPPYCQCIFTLICTRVYRNPKASVKTFIQSGFDFYITCGKFIKSTYPTFCVYLKSFAPKHQAEFKVIGLQKRQLQLLRFCCCSTVFMNC